MRLIDPRLHDGSRNFADLPETYDVAAPQWHALRAHVATLTGAAVTGFITDDVTEAWIDFTFAGHTFHLNNQCGAWWCIVDEPACPDPILLQVALHLETLLAPLAALARARGPIAAGQVRTLIVEPDGRLHHTDHPDLAAARAHAADAAAETEDDRGPPLAAVFDDGFARR